MLQITTSSVTPDSTYFRTTDAEPSLEGGELTIYDGAGTHRSSWGAPGVTSTIVFQSDEMVAIHVGFFHKHGGGQFWRYYRLAEHWEQAVWKQLSDEERQLVLNAYENHKAPSFAKVPGKLRTEHKKPETKTRTTYKIVQVIN